MTRRARDITIIVVVALVVACLLGYGIYMFVDYENPQGEKFARRRIAALFGFEVPKEGKMVYHYLQNYFQDRDQQYTVFEFENDPSEFLNENGFSGVKNKEFEIDFKGQFWKPERFPDELIAEYIPNFEKPYLYFETDHMYLIYAPTNHQLMVFISAD